MILRVGVRALKTRKCTTGQRKPRTGWPFGHDHRGAARTPDMQATEHLSLRQNPTRVLVQKTPPDARQSDSGQMEKGGKGLDSQGVRRPTANMPDLSCTTDRQELPRAQIQVYWLRANSLLEATPVFRSPSRHVCPCWSIQKSALSAFFFTDFRIVRTSNASRLVARQPMSTLRAEYHHAKRGTPRSPLKSRAICCACRVM